jgi:hypothetical protein
MHPMTDRGYFGNDNPDYFTIDAISKNLLIVGNKQSPPAMDATLAAAGRALLEISSSPNTELQTPQPQLSPMQQKRKRAQTGKSPKVQLPVRHNLVLGRIVHVDITDGTTSVPYSLNSKDTDQAAQDPSKQTAPPVLSDHSKGVTGCNNTGGGITGGGMFAVMKVEFNAGLHSWDYDWVGNRLVWFTVFDGNSTLKENFFVGGTPRLTYSR